MKDHALEYGHSETLAWLDDSLEWARPRDRTRVVKLLNLVRTEILFDIEFSESTSSTPAPAEESVLGANRSV